MPAALAYVAAGPELARGQGDLEHDGYCRIAGRLKEMIIRGGENIYPREIEAVLTSHPGVAEAGLAGSAPR